MRSMAQSVHGHSMVVQWLRKASSTLFKQYSNSLSEHLELFEYSHHLMQVAHDFLLWLQLVRFPTWLVGNLPSSLFCTEDFFMYTFYLWKLAQCFCLLNQQNSKIGPCHRNYASIQFWAGCRRLNSHLNARTYAHTITLNWMQNSWNSLFQNCPNMVLPFSLFNTEFSNAQSIMLRWFFWILDQLWVLLCCMTPAH